MARPPKGCPVGAKPPDEAEKYFSIVAQTPFFYKETWTAGAEADRMGSCDTHTPFANRIKEKAKMELKEILARCDHTLLAQTAVWDEIRTVCDDAITYGCASVCIPASYVRAAADYAAGRIPVCTVIGFPNGYDTTAAKAFEAGDAAANGASEIDMVANLG